MELYRGMEWPKRGEWDYIKRKWEQMKLQEANKILLGAMLSDLGYDEEIGGVQCGTQEAKDILANEEFLIYQHLVNQYHSRGLQKDTR